MLSDTDAAFVAIILALCLINEKNCLWFQEWYKCRPQQTHENLSTDLMLSEIIDYIFFSVLFDGPSFDRVLTTANPTVDKTILTSKKHSLSVSVYALHYAIWPMELISKT